LAGATEGQGIRGHVFGDAAGCRYVGATSNLDGRNERRVAADEDAVSDYCRVLVDAVVVAGDRSGTDVDTFSDFGVAEIGQVIRLGALAQLDFLSFDEVADMSAFADFAAGAQVGIGAEDGS
jgi:hypothetical protein